MKKYILFLGLINAINTYAMEQSNGFDRTYVESTITSLKKSNMPLEKFLESGYIFSQHKTWWKKYTKATIEEKKLQSLRKLNNSLVSVEGPLKQWVLDIKDILEKDENNNNNNGATPSEILSPEKTEKNISDALTEFFKNTYEVSQGIDLQKIMYLVQQKMAKIMFEYLQRRRGIVATIGGEEVPQEVVTWMDNIYIPFSLQQYLLETQEVENSEQNLVDTIMQLHIAENKPVDNEQNLVDGMKKLKMMMDQ